MAFDAELAAIRFGCGLSPIIAPPRSADAVLAGLTGPDDAAARFPVERFDRFQLRLRDQRALGQAKRKAKSDRETERLDREMRAQRRAGQAMALDAFRATLLRRAWSMAPFRERLTTFWADHFTATGKGGVMRSAMAPYIESAIRPNLAERFETLLIAAVTHPVMLHYLDQTQSAGPNSALAKRRQQSAGLNENLAREVLELHTLGVGGGYDQTDVTQLAKLFTGLSATAEDGFVFRAGMAEPGAETVLGKRYGGGTARFEDVAAVLRDLARHPTTAQHVCGKLARHFVSDTPDAGLVAAMVTAWRDTDGDLPTVYRAMLTHPRAWDDADGRIKQPMDYLGSTLRALAVPPDAVLSLSRPRAMTLLVQPLRMMGQDWGQPAGPDGLPDEDAAWLTPQSIAARLQWALAVAHVLSDRLPDPREFVSTALGARVPGSVRFAAEAAETRWEGVALILASPAFQRM